MTKITIFWLMDAKCPEEVDLFSKHTKSPCMQTVGLWAQDPSEEKWVKFLGIFRVASPR